MNDGAFFPTFTQILREAAGLEFNDGRAEILERRVCERMATLGFESWIEYRNHVTSHAGEISRLIEAVTVNETFFFRHPEQFEYIRRVILPPLAANAARTGKPLRIWSCGCSNGCEPYTMAILCFELAAWQGPFPFEIIATDIDGSILANARKGLFTGREVQTETPTDLQKRYFTPAEDRWQISQRVMGAVRFVKMNLITDIIPRGVSIVLCRNVLYYFSPAMREEIIKRIWHSLNPDDFLILGPSEISAGREAFYRLYDPGNRILQAWTTDRRGPDHVHATSSEANRRQLHPFGEVHAEKGRVILSGILSHPADLKSFRTQLAVEISSAGHSLILDARPLRWISNEILHELRQMCMSVLKSTRTSPEAGHAKPARVDFQCLIVNSEIHKDWFETAGFRIFVRELRIEPAGDRHGGTDASRCLPQTVGTPFTHVSDAFNPSKFNAGTPTPLGGRSRPTQSAPLDDDRKIPFPYSPPDRTVRISLPAEINDAGLAGFNQSLLQAAKLAMADGAGEVVIDASDCRYIEELGAQALARFYRSLPDGKKLAVREAKPAVRRLMSNYLPAECFA